MPNANDVPDDRINRLDNLTEASIDATEKCVQQLVELCELVDLTLTLPKDRFSEEEIEAAKRAEELLDDFFDGVIGDRSGTERFRIREDLR